MIKTIICLIDTGNAKFIIEKDNNQFKLPSINYNIEFDDIGEAIANKYELTIKKDTIELLEDTNEYRLVKAIVDKYTHDNRYEEKIINDAYQIVSDKIHKELLAKIQKNILYETINDSFWLGIILTVEDKIKDNYMKAIFAEFLLSQSAVFCEEVVNYKIGGIINPKITNTYLKKMRNSFLKEIPLYDSKNIKKIIEEMGIEFERNNVFDIVLYLDDEKLLDINSRNWSINKSNEHEIYNGIILSPRRWIKNNLPKEVNNLFEEKRDEIVNHFINELKDKTIIPRSYCTKALLDKNLSYNEKIYILQRIGKIKTIDFIANTLKTDKCKIEKDENGFYLNYNYFMIKVKAALIETIWNDNKCNKIPFLKEILNNIPEELDEDFFMINRKCRDNIHYGFYNYISEKEFDLLEKNQSIYLKYLTDEFDKRVKIFFDKKYWIKIKIANFLYKIQKENLNKKEKNKE